jgi:anti-sigma B factor antagonist
MEEPFSLQDQFRVTSGLRPLFQKVQNQSQRLDIHRNGNVAVVRFRDRRITDGLEIEELGRELYQLAADDGHGKLVLNFAAVEFLSSATLGKLIKLHGKMKAGGGMLKLCNIRPQIFEVFKICGLDRVFDIRADEADALAAF